MASAKESPRQKMVGMMYLVLTALLALQVSSALIYKFQSLNESLEKATNENKAWNEQKIQRIEKEIQKRGNKKEEVELLHAAKLITAKSKDAVEYIEKLKGELIKETGGYDEDGSLKGAKEETKVEIMMLGANKNGKAYELKSKLNEFINSINTSAGTNYAKMALDGKEDPLFKNNADQRNKDFAELNFGQTPLVASLAVLSEFQSRITAMQTTSITALGEKIGMQDFMVDQMMPMVSPSSRVIAAGTKYEAKLFMTASSSTLRPKMQFGGSEVAVDDHGVGKVSFTASGGNYVNGMVKKNWTGKITMKNPAGKDTTYLVSEDYYVAQPVIQVQAQAVKALYRNCGNKLNVQVPALGNTYNPKITADGATVINGPTKGMVTVIPTGAKVKLKVSSDGNYIGDEDYGVRLIPMPTIEVKINNSKIDPLKGVKKDLLRNISVKAIADGEFKSFLPDDANYKIEEFIVTLAAGNRGKIAPMIVKNREFVEIGNIRDNAVENNRILIEVTKVKRKNYLGQWEDVKIPVTIATATVVN